ncbi:uncharacterized protein LOC135573336 isoform X2 [Oncorhynchus nerka]|uniref:uncharacterized protein LOC135573336 isoform X2 n=1 Tax=Oncorhynchus nerka TaxID=8023 RepID=UPI0031B7FF83
MNPACLSPSTLSPNLQSLGPDCDSGAQFALQDPEMASVKLEDCSQTLELNVNIKDEEEEEEIGTSVSHGDHVETFSTSREQQQEDQRAKRSHHCPHFLSHRFNSRTDSGRSRAVRPPKRPSRTASWHQCVGGNTIHPVTVSACTAPGPPQESLVRNGTRTSLP